MTTICINVKEEDYDQAISLIEKVLEKNNVEYEIYQQGDNQ